MQNPQWLEWARRFQALAQNGLAFCKDPYERERYEEIQRLAAEMMATGAGLPETIPILARVYCQAYYSPAVFLSIKPANAVARLARDLNKPKARWKREQIVRLFASQ